MFRLPIGVAALCLAASSFAAAPFDDKFRQLDELLPTPGTIRTASGAPGHAYWQQRADYTIRTTLDEARRALSGAGTVTYHNNSPDTLKYLWVQLDQNIYKTDSDARQSAILPSREAWANGTQTTGLKYDGLRTVLEGRTFPGGFDILAVKDAGGRPLPYTINKTMMRIDLPQPLKPGAKVTFGIDWRYNINEQKVLGGRAGYEKFDDKNDLFEIAQWFPRMAAYYDVYGWQHKQFLGSGEFTLEFGDYDVRITVPGDHIVASTGELQNPGEVLSAAQRDRLQQAKTAKQARHHRDPGRSRSGREGPQHGRPKPGTSRPKNVRDFAFASSRKFIWDAQGDQERQAATCWRCRTTRRKAIRCGKNTRPRRSSTPSSSTTSTRSTTRTRPRSRSTVRWAAWNTR